MTPITNFFFEEITNVINNLKFDHITDERKIVLKHLVGYIQHKAENDKEISLNFICTHNSRRSHLSQIWAQTAAAHYDVKNVFCYSGGTEATAMFPMVVKTLRNQGFKIKSIAEGSNPIYAVKYAFSKPPIIAFSKTFDDDFNPKNEFAAILTCSSADKGCPFIAGAEVRIPMIYEDPKVFDNTLLQIEKYAERSVQIATEMFYIFSQIKK